MSSRRLEAEHFISGGLSGIFTKTIIAPLERGKILFQLKGLEENRSYKIIDTYRNVIREEGFRSLYKGNLTNCMKAVPTYGLKFGFYNHFLNNSRNNHFQSGLITGFIQTTVIYPLDLVKTRLSILEKMGFKYNGIYDCFRTTIKKEGVLSLYKGFNPTIFIGTLYVGLQMSTYNYYKTNICNIALISGSLTGLSLNILFYPSDIVKRRLQLNGINNEKRKYKNVRDCIFNIIRKEGMIGMYRGMPITLLKIIPANALQFGLYEYFNKLFFH